MLKHKNIVKLYNYDHQKDKVFLIMEYVNQGNLFEHLQKLKKQKKIMPMVKIKKIFK